MLVGAIHITIACKNLAPKCYTFIQNNVAQSLADVSNVRLPSNSTWVTKYFWNIKGESWKIKFLWEIDLKEEKVVDHWRLSLVTSRREQRKNLRGIVRSSKVILKRRENIVMCGGLRTKFYKMGQLEESKRMADFISLKRGNLRNKLKSRCITKAGITRTAIVLRSVLSVSVPCSNSTDSRNLG